MTKSERVLWRALRQTLSDPHWRKQVPFGPYVADFACHSAKLIVEVDGGQHAEAAAYDRVRTLFLEAQGYRVLRFWNNDVLSNTDGVLERIAQSLSHWEREGSAERREGEGEAISPSPFQAFGAGPSLSRGRGEQVTR
jgi:very-short-patch-repair endonuclease